MSRRSCVGLLCAALWACGSDERAPAADGGPSGGGRRSEPADAALVERDAALPRRDAGVADASRPKPAECKIPDNLMLSERDADGGYDPECQNVPRKVIANNCIGGICHDSNGPPAGKLDLMAPCVADRMINVPSSCEGLLLIDTEHPERSFLYDKLLAKPKCGESMPFTGVLPEDEARCMNAWINAVIRAARSLM